MSDRYFAGKDICEALMELFKNIEVMPAADVTEVVRCKDCRLFQTDGCRYDWPVQNANDYCSYGRRKEGEE